MLYLGGKAQIAKHVARVIDEHRAHSAQPVWEPFCGGLNVTSALWARDIEVYASDVSEPLIALYRAVRDGWNPPEHVTEEQYAAAKRGEVAEPLRSFLLFGCSFGGKPGGGFARNASGRNYASESRRALIRDVPRAASIACIDFLAETPEPLDALIYCDPPYRGRTGYGFAFDHDAFVERCVGWASRGVRVLVSEYDFPVGRVVWERMRAAGLRGREATHLERIYLVGATA
jgi:DNA adenine methylase